MKPLVNYTSALSKKKDILMIFTFYLAEMTSRNLEEYSQFLRRKAPQFTIRSVLMQNEVIIEPEAAFVIDGAINVVRRMVENTKRFVRFYRGSYIPIGPVYITGHLDRVLPSFFDEISGLPSIVQKVEVIQTSLIDILKMMFNYLNEWKVKKELIAYCANLHIIMTAKEYELQIKEIDCGRDCKVAVNQPRDLRSTFMQLSC